MEKNLMELAQMISKRDKISILEAEEQIALCQLDMEYSIGTGNYPVAQMILQEELNLTPDYIKLFCDDLN